MTKALSIVVLFAFLTGCSSTPRVAVEDLSGWTPAFLDGEGGGTLTLAEVASRAARADVVVIGEMHGHAKGLRAAEDLFAAIVEQQPTAALGLEFYERDTQAAIDDYLAGITDEDGFREATGKVVEKDSHRPLIEMAKDAGIRVWAINAPRRYVRLARTQGFEAYEGMTEAQRGLVVAPEELSGGRYAETFYELMSGMSAHDESEQDAEVPEGPSEMAVSFFRSQNVWDATMADSAVKALDAGARPLVIIVGQFHSDFEGGLVERLRESAPGARVLTVSVVETDSFDEEDADRADVLIGTGATTQ